MQAGSGSLLMLAGHPADGDNEGKERATLKCQTGFGTCGLEYVSVSKMQLNMLFHYYSLDSS